MYRLKVKGIVVQLICLRYLTQRWLKVDLIG